MMRALGIDLAHGTTGLVCLPDNFAAGELAWEGVGHAAIDGSDVAKIHPVQRREAIVRRVLDVADQLDADLLVAEEHFAARNSAASLLAKLHAELERRCHHEGRELVKLTRAFAYKTALGRGNVAKEALQVFLREADCPFWQCQDRCDAFAVANAALSLRGFQFIGVAA